MTTNIYPQGVDESLLMSQYAEDAWEFFVELFDLFMTDARAQLSGLEMAVASQDFATIKSIAHRLKGSSPWRLKQNLLQKPLLFLWEFSRKWQC